VRRQRREHPASWLPARPAARGAPAASGPDGAASELAGTACPRRPRFALARQQGLEWLGSQDSALAREIEQVDAAARAELRGLGLDALPRFLLHGDFTTGNVRQRRGRPYGAIDFDLCHVGHRPWELVIARLQRAPAMLDGYRSEAARLGIPLSTEEARVLPAVYHVFRTGMIGWALVEGAQLGNIDANVIRVQLHKLRLGLVATGQHRRSD
jgi:Phosphotransferase enzyme family